MSMPTEIIIKQMHFLICYDVRGIRHVTHNGVRCEVMFDYLLEIYLTF